MKKMIDLIAEPGSQKDRKLLDYVRREYLINQKMTNICFITGIYDKDGTHKQISADELRNTAFNQNTKDTLYFLRSFYFLDDLEGYTKVVEEMCENDIQIFKTDSKVAHLPNSKEWIEKYVTLLSIEDV